MYHKAYFYPRSPCGERPRAPSQHPCPRSISIHALLAESDHGLYSLVAITPSFLSTLSLRRATVRQSLKKSGQRISIHALLAESDWQRGSRITYVEISIHALLAESDNKPTQRAGYRQNFYPRSPCGERHDLEPSTTRRLTFLSTLSLRRATSPQVTMSTWQKVFLSTLSLRRATSTHCKAVS